jgi:hypothetical protein
MASDAPESATDGPGPDAAAVGPEPAAQAERRPLPQVVRWGIAFVAIAVVVTLLLAATSRSPGPLTTNVTTSTEFTLAEGQVGSWGSPLPANTTPDELTIESIEPIGLSGLELVGLAVTYPEIDGSIATAYGYPPPGLTTHPPEGARVSAAGGPTPSIQILAGVRLLPGAASGRIDGWHIRYSSGKGRPHETTIPWALIIYRTGAGPAPSA